MILSHARKPRCRMPGTEMGTDTKVQRTQATASLPPLRKLACARCSVEFGCQNEGPTGSCWCSGESFRLPQPLPDEFAAFGDCLCPQCLRWVAETLKARGLGPKEITP